MNGRKEGFSSPARHRAREACAESGTVEELARMGREMALCFLEEERWWTSYDSGLWNSIGMGMSDLRFRFCGLDTRGREWEGD
jgi:hypothetical protein